MEEIVVEVAGVRSPIRIAGPDGPEAVVFVHGNPGSGRDWADLQRKVSSLARTVAPDMPGYAGADKPRGFDYSMQGYARHLDGILSELEVERAHLVLHDFGGAWGLEWVLQNPHAAASVTLLGIGVFRDYWWHRWARLWRLPLLGTAAQYTTPRLAARAIIASENPTLSSEQVNRLSRLIAPFATRRAILAAYRATPPAAWEYGQSGSGEARLADLLSEIDLPALVLWPTEDYYVPYQPEYQREAFPRAQIELFEGHGHWLHWEAPERVANLVIPFLREQLSARSAVG
jgi:pimeloyl-ACP methyl ester carboxylesterase